MDVVYLLVVIVSILVGMTVHEAVHAYAGMLLGDTTAEEEGRLSLNPLRHIDPFTTVILPIMTYIILHAPVLAAKPVPFSPHKVRFGEMGAALIAGAGPLSNLLLAIVAAGILRAIGQEPSVAYALDIFLQLNVGLFIFNLVPIPPLDGSRVLYALAPESVQDVMRQIEPYGFFVIIALVFLTGFGAVLISLNQAILHLLVGV